MILVTGATGFVGSELVKQLLDLGYSVRALKRPASSMPPILQGRDEIEWFEADILDYFALEEAFEGIKQVYHCAAFISFNPLDKKKLHQVNVEGTANIVNLCLQKETVKLLHVSSVAALGDAKPGQLISEKTHWEFDGRQHGYSISKHESEMEVWRGIAEGLHAIIVNPSLIIGKNAGTSGSGQVFETVSKGLKFYTRGSVGLIDVEDVAKCMIRLMESNISGEGFLLSAENWPYRDLLSQIAREFGISEPTTEAKAWMLSLAWRAAAIASRITGKAYGITKDTARSALKRQSYSNLKIKQAIGIEFKPIQQTIHEICQLLKENRCEQKLLHY